MRENTLLESLRRGGCSQRDLELARMSRLVTLALEQGRQKQPARKR